MDSWELRQEYDYDYYSYSDGYEYYYLNFESKEDAENFFKATHFTIADIEALGIDMTGFYAGTADVRYCHDCGLVWLSSLSCYTYTAEKGTLRQDIEMYIYGGDAQNDAFRYAFIDDPYTAHLHQYVYDYNMCGENCEDGVDITETCWICNETDTRTTYDHQYTSEITKLKTQCGMILIEENTCSLCEASESIYSDNGAHSFYKSATLTVRTDAVYQSMLKEYLDDRYTLEEATRELTRNNISYSDLQKMGIDTDNAYYWNTVDVYSCFLCGLKHYSISWYTHTAEEGCLYHDDDYYDYAGNTDYESFTYLEKSERSSHYTGYYGQAEEKELSELVQTITDLRITLPFTPTDGSAYRYNCKGCEKLQELDVYLNNDSDHLSCYIYYNEDGTVSRWDYSAYVYELDYVQAVAGDYYLSGTTSGYVRYYAYSSGSLYTDIYMETSSENSLYIELYEYSSSKETNHVYVTAHDHANCWTTKTRYDYDNKTNRWVKNYSEENEAHHYITSYYVQENCKEDGKYVYGNVCSVCKQQIGDTKVSYSHNYYYTASVSDVQDYAYRLTAGEISSIAGLTAEIYIEYYCSHCPSLRNCVISLQDDWTLTRDVYLKAEGITINFNGYTIDLNGYKLIIYGYSGSNVILTDSEFDTSMGEKNDTALADGSEEQSGMIILGTNGGDVSLGCIAINVKYFLSDADSRDTLLESAENSTETKVEEA
jgi:hypothetical protein